MKAALGVVGVGQNPLTGDPEDTSTTPQTWRCQHCGKLITRKHRASFNGAPLCHPYPGEETTNCYLLVSKFDHQMPCEGDPCPGETPMTHTHDNEE